MHLSLCLSLTASWSPSWRNPKGAVACCRRNDPFAAVDSTPEPWKTTSALSHPGMLRESTASAPSSSPPLSSGESLISRSSSAGSSTGGPSASSAAASATASSSSSIVDSSNPDRRWRSPLPAGMAIATRRHGRSRVGTASCGAGVPRYAPPAGCCKAPWRLFPRVRARSEESTAQSHVYVRTTGKHARSPSGSWSRMRRSQATKVPLLDRQSMYSAAR